MRAARCGGAYPRCPARVARCACRCLQRDVDGPSTCLTGQRPAPGRRADGSRSRRPDCDRCRRGASNGAEAATAEEAHGRRARKGRRAADLQREPKAAARGRRKAAWRPAKVSGSPTGFPGRPAEAFRAGSDPALGCRRGARVPVAPPRGFPRDGRRVLFDSTEDARKSIAHARIAAFPLSCRTASRCPP